MFGRLKNWTYNHRKALAITCGSVLAGGYLVYYLSRRANEMQENLRKQQFLEYQRQAFFDNITATFRSTAETSMGPLREALASATPVPSAADIRAVQSKEEKLERWEEVKIFAFTRACCSIYATALLSLMLNVQVSLVGRFLFLASREKDGPTALYLSNTTQENFLNYAQYLINTGIAHLSNHIQSAVHSCLHDWDLKRQCTFEDLKTIFNNIRKQVEIAASEEESCSILINFLLPEEGDTEEEETKEQKKDIQLAMLLNETRNLIESPAFGNCLTSATDAGFECLFEALRPLFSPKKIVEIDSEISIKQNGGEGEAGTQQRESQPMFSSPLANVLGSLKRTTASLLSEEPNRLLNSVIDGCNREADLSYHVFNVQK